MTWFYSILNHLPQQLVTMKRLSCILFGLSLCLSLGSLSGCGAPKPTIIEQPKLTPEEAAEKEAAYDKSMRTDS